ncbi:hypothetical protein CL617_03555 [archaeon]|nr:hypothetical protein [archaeon]|tara:strand:+ start:745 stop:1479 length:735 start_codon:yes stop_codon:yes gene_type:complete
MRVIATVEARMAATRLPGKVLADIKGKPELQIFLERVTKAKKIDDIIVATTTNPKDIEIVNLCKKLNVKYFRGSEEDVLSRVLAAAKSLNADIIVELCADDPFMDPTVIDAAIEHFLNNDFDYMSNFHPLTFPPGIGVQIFPLKVLDEIDKLTNNPYDRENVTWYIYHNKDKYKCGNYPAPKHLADPKTKLDLDYPEDLEFIRKVFDNFDDIHFSLRDVLDLLEKNPELKEINANRYVGDERYE